MATASMEPDAKSRNTMYKYESMRTKWTKYFDSHPDQVRNKVKRFFSKFHQSHAGFQFFIGKLFDGTTFAFVQPDDYQQVKKELEKITGQTLPDVAQMRDVTITERRSFRNLNSFLEFSKPFKDKNAQISQRRKQEAKESVDMVRDTLQTRPTGRTMAFDVEVYEHDFNVLLEIGYVMTNFNGTEAKKFYHYIIEDNIDFENKDHVPDNRERFKFGTSQRLSLEEATAKFKQHLAQTEFLVTHSGSNDEEYLANYGISVAGKPMFDTQILALDLLPAGPPVYGLKRLLSDLAIPFDEDVLHNAGNDAAYTMQVFLALMKKL